MKYSEAEDFLFNELAMFQSKGKVAYNGDLGKTIELSSIVDDPHKKIKTIHVAGTNGKGSVSHLLAAGLQANGYKVGLFTSPHYKNYRERIKINGTLIEEEEVAAFIGAHYEEFKRLKPSFFEITCIMAFYYFAKSKVDYAVIETGLGGRLDSTNIIRPLLSIITNIGFDHQNILGNSLAEIASEKAGIIKSNIPVIIGETQAEISGVFEERAKFMKSPILFAEDHCNLKISNAGENGYLRFLVAEAGWNIRFQSSNTHAFHIKNLKTALYGLFILRNQIPLDLHKIVVGMEHFPKLTYYIGRWMNIQENPKVIFDSAHNVAGVEALVDQINQMTYGKLHLVWGAVKDKDISEILRLLPPSASYYFAKASIDRGLDATELKAKAEKMNLFGSSYDSVKEAYLSALSAANPTDLIIVSGSSFVVAELL